ncbi:FecR domain-containing protein [Olivibacter sp. CPCC 100613]|uniref:FecR family protein n=1 Tax=Olivibacter sp. CPCC 100613 TaxID=3079931 RepID=UPI002FF6B286
MTKERLFYLLRMHIQNQLSTDEEEELMAYASDEESRRLLDEVMRNLGETMEVPADFQVPGKEMFEEIRHDDRFMVDREQRVGVFQRWQHWALLITGIAAIWFLVYVRMGAAPEEKAILPGKKTAILTLANGEEVHLEATENKRIKLEDGAQVQVSNGSVVYEPVEKSFLSDRVMENTITTPAGGEYQLILPDGTKAWLNAASSIRYPVDFGNNARKVSVVGEVYLEVAQRKNQPFYVKAGSTQIEVLGTKFNISAYREDQAGCTTLLEGRVKVLAHGQEQLLKPGQQAVVTQKEGPIQVNEVDAEEVLAWKNGYFSFSNEPLELVMKKISRWYNVDVEYAMDPSNKRLEGTISRMEDIQQLLRALELTKAAHFKIKEGRIIVMD